MKRFLLLLLLFLAPWSHGAVRAVLDRDRVMVGESAALSIISENQKLDAIGKFPAIPGLTIIYSSSGQEFSNNQGQVSNLFIYNYNVIASREGEFIIPAVEVVAGGQRAMTSEVKLVVTRAAAEAGRREAFAKLLVSKTNVYVGEVFPIEVQLYVTQAQQLQLPELKSDGFIIQKQAPYGQTRTQVGNMLYNVLTFRSAVAAAKAGELDLGPARLSFNLLVRQQRNAADPWRDIFGQTMVPVPKVLETEIYKMHVRPLPRTNVPPSFSGAIGKFAMNVDVSPLTLNAGDPITLRLVVSGRGNLDMIQMPRLDWPGFKFYEPQANVSSSDPLGMEGSKTFEQVIIPDSADLKEIPEVTFSFFDPTEGVYRTLRRSSVPLQVKAAPGATNALAVVQSGTGDTSESPRDIVHIKSSQGEMLALAPPLVTQPWFLGMQAVPLAVLLSAWVYRKQTHKLARNPRLRRKLETRKFLQEALPELERLAAAQETDHFYALVFRLLQEQLGDRFNLPSSAITEAVLDQELPKHNAAPHLVEELHHLFQQCNQARYAPGGAGAHLHALVPRVRHALQELQALPD